MVLAQILQCSVQLYPFPGQYNKDVVKLGRFQLRLTKMVGGLERCKTYTDRLCEWDLFRLLKTKLWGRSCSGLPQPT